MENQAVKSSRVKGISALVLVILLAALTLGFAIAQTQENVITVGSSIEGDTLFTQDIKQNNDGRCTLREAIIAANTDGKSGGKPGECAAGNGADVIELPPGYVYTLSRTDSGNENSSQTGDLDIAGDVTIRPAGPGGIVVIEGDSGFNDRIVHVLETGDLTLRDVTIRGGNEKDAGGGIYNQGILEMTNVTLTANFAQNNGGGLYNVGNATLSYVTVQGNVAASGDALANGSGTLSLNYSYIEDESCSGVISVAAGVENLAPAASGCPATHSEKPALSLDAFDFDGDGASDYFTLPEGSNAINTNTAETACSYASPDPLGMERPQGSTCDLGANEVEEVNLPPIAVDDPNSTTPEDVAVTINVAGNDSDPNGNLDPSSVTVVSGPSFGDAVPTAGQPGSITYTPDTDFDGADSVTYQICDTENLCDTAVVTIFVTADSYIEVTNTANSGPGSLREAIQKANALAVPGTIIFEIAPDFCAPATISVTEALPLITSQVTIDGLLREDGACASPHITIDGANGAYDGLVIAPPAANSTAVSDLTIQNFGMDGVVIQGTGAPGQGSIIQRTTISNNGRNGVTIGSLETAADGNSLLDNTIADNCGSSVLIYGLGASSGFDPLTILGNTLQQNTITNNGYCGLDDNGMPLNDGVTIAGGLNNEISGNNISGNADLSVDLGGDGPTDNDIDDPDDGANYQQNYPWLVSATPEGEITGYLNSAPGADFTLQFFVTPSCENSSSSSEPIAVLPFEYSTNGDGNVWFSVTVQAPDSLNFGQNVISTATDGLGNTSEYSRCIPVDDDNTVWTNAPNKQSGDVVQQKLKQNGQSRWYRFQAGPNSRITLTLENLPENYDLVVFGDIGEAYAELVGNANLDLNRLDSEFPTDAFAPSTFSPSTFSPSTFSPSTFSPSTFSPSTFSPSTFSPSTFSPSTFSPDVYSPSTFSPSTFSPSTFSPSTFSPSTFSPSTFSGNAYSAAQMTTLIAVSGNDGQADEEITFNSHNNYGWFYARVRGRQGVFNEDIDFKLGLEIDEGVCEGIQDNFGNPALPAVHNNGRETVIVVDWNRMGLGDPADSDRIALEAKLAQLAAHSTVNGVIIDVGEMIGGQPKYPQVYDSNNQADEFDDEDGSGSNYRLCPYAKNVVADAVKEVIDTYRVNNPVKYIVIVGDDDTVPFYRIPDQALLGPEQDYVVPVNLDSSSEASLRNNYFLSQDGYGSAVNLAMNNNTMPLPKIAIGRVLETPQQIINVVDAYLDMPVLQPQKALITAYDFLTDNGEGVRDVLAGDGNIAIDQELLVTNPNTWTADQLKNKIDSTDFDLAFLAGHFSANETLAADYETKYTTIDFLNSPQDFKNAIVFSGGCHSGYNIVNDHAIPDYTLEPDWPAVMAERGVTLIAGTGYQYGDTDFLEYSERLYLEFTRQLRSDVSTNISVGDALVRAKKQYLIDTPIMRGIHQKSLLQATIYGLPMTSVQMNPNNRLDLSADGPWLTTGELFPVNDLPDIDTEPGEVLGLKYYDLTRSYNLTEKSKDLLTVEDENVSVQATYLENGPDGVSANAAEPVLPLDSINATVANSNLVLRGIGFLEGSYRDFADRVPLMGAPTTEVSATHFDFLSFVFYPQQMWSINRFDTLTNGAGNTILNLTPAQNRSEEVFIAGQQQTATQRRYDSLKLRLFYLSDDFVDAVYVGENRPEAAAAPTIVNVQAQPNGGSVEYEALVIGDPSVGVQSVWVSYTQVSSPTGSGTNGQWLSMPLQQDEVDSRIWRGTMNNVTNPHNQRFIVQAVNGGGLVTLANNNGRFFIPGVVGQPTTLAETAGPSPREGQIGTTASFSADLNVVGGTGGEDLSGLPILFSIGEDLRLGWTNAGGSASVNIPLLGTPPGEQPVTISFPGSAVYKPSAANTASFEVFAADTTLTLDADTVYVSDLDANIPLIAELRDGQERRLAEKTVTFTVTGGGKSVQKAVITDPDGRARLGVLNLQTAADYTVTARFDGTSSYNASTAPGSATIIFNRPPVCASVFVETANGKPSIWPSNNKLVGLRLDGATDPDGDALDYYFTSIYQDEPLGGDQDGTISNGCADAEARAERDGNGDGRVYHVSFLVDDGNGGTCSGVTRIAVDHDQSNIDAIDDGANFNSLGEDAPACTP